MSDRELRRHEEHSKGLEAAIPRILAARTPDDALMALEKAMSVTIADVNHKYDGEISRLWLAKQRKDWTASDLETFKAALVSRARVAQGARVPTTETTGCLVIILALVTAVAAYASR